IADREDAGGQALVHPGPAEARGYRRGEAHGANSQLVWLDDDVGADESGLVAGKAARRGVLVGVETDGGGGARGGGKDKSQKGEQEPAKNGTLNSHWWTLLMFRYCYVRR